MCQSKQNWASGKHWGGGVTHPVLRHYQQDLQKSCVRRQKNYVRRQNEEVAVGVGTRRIK